MLHKVMSEFYPFNGGFIEKKLKIIAENLRYSRLS